MGRIHAVIASRTRAEPHEPTSEMISLSLVVGVVAIVAGFAAIGLAWRHTSQTDQLWVQNQEILAGGIGGLGSILVGVGLLIRDRLVRNHALLARQLERLLADSETADADALVGKPRLPENPSPEPAAGEFVAVPPAIRHAGERAASNGRRRRNARATE